MVPPPGEGAARRFQIWAGETLLEMEALTPELVAGLTLSAGLGLLMVSLARGKDMLEQRNAARRCPSCGHLLDPNGSCGCLQ
jgi:hypothetical protein